MSDDRRMIYEGQAVSAAIDIKVIGNKFVSIAAESLLREPKNCNISKSTSGVVKAVEDDRIRVHFRPLSDRPPSSGPGGMLVQRWPLR